MKRALVLCGVLLGFHFTSWAQEAELDTPTATPAPFTVSATAPDAQRFSSYYQIEEPQAQEAQTHAFVTPMQMLELAADQLQDTAASLLRWDHQNEGWPEPTERYDRRGQFGGWLGGRGNPACQNTRAKALLRDTEGPVTFSPNGCTVRTGKWHDPYTNVDHENANEIQIDHMVPLKNAYDSGAWKWDHKTRCAYTNFLANNFHLLSVDGHQNQSKGELTPADWMPPNPAYHCTYLKNWLAIKLIWGLIMNPLESDAIKNYFASEHCDRKVFTITAEELKAQRQAIAASLESCH